MIWRYLFGLLIGLMAVVQAAHAQYVPQGAPNYSYHWYGNGESCEYLFVGTFRLVLPNPRRPTNMLLDRQGDLVWYNQPQGFTLDFKVQPNGRITYSDGSRWHVLDSNFNEVDSLACQGYPSDDHDLILRADGHSFLICWEGRVMDLSSLLTANGNPGSTQGDVRAVVLQELDPGKQVVREWHAFDHLSITDSDTMFFTNANLLDLTHTNSIDLDSSGNLLVSHRHLNALTMIDWPTGQIKWQLSGKNNDFDLLGDPGFYGQHDARILGGDRISVFDNGNFHHPGRGVVMHIDTALWKATVLQSFGNSVMSNSMGSFRYFPDGKGLVNLGEINSGADAAVTYYAADSSKVFDINLPTTYATYRAQCFDLPFQLHRPVITCTVQSGQVTLGVDGSHGSYEWTNGAATSTIVLSDTGRYQVFVPYGIGMISSEPVYVTDLQNGCAAVGATPGAVMVPRPARLVDRVDLLGNAVLRARAFQVVIERYSDGSAKKVVGVGE